MMRRARRALLWLGAALALGYVGLVVAVSWASTPEWRVSLPAWSDWLGVGALATVLAGLLLAALTLRGAARVAAVLALPFAGLFGFAALVVCEFVNQNQELGRVALPDGRVAVLTLEPVPTDAVYALWWVDGIGLRRMLRPVEQITYSEDGSFTDDPALVLTPDGRRLLIRRGGIWTDCVELTDPPRICRNATEYPSGLREDFLARSEQIAALIGLPP